MWKGRGAKGGQTELLITLKEDVKECTSVIILQFLLPVLNYLLRHDKLPF
jgi:hypothetical protein